MAFAEAGWGIAACVYDGDEDRGVADAARGFGTGGRRSRVEVLWGWSSEGEARHSQHGGCEEGGVHLLLLEGRKERTNGRWCGVLRTW
jgi:hypothetical protein